MANFLADQLVSLNKKRDRLVETLLSSNSDLIKEQTEKNRDDIIRVEKELADIAEKFDVDPDEDDSPTRGSGKYPLLKNCSEFAYEIFKKM